MPRPSVLRRLALLAFVGCLAGALVVVGPVSTVGATSAQPATPSPGPAPSSSIFDSPAPPTEARWASMAPSTTLLLSVGLAYPDPSAVATFDAAVQDPGSPLYHHYLTGAEFSARFGPTGGEASSVSDYLGGQGARNLTWSGAHQVLSFTMSEAEVARTFGTALAWYRSPSGAPYYAVTSDPILPSELSGRVVGVDGLTDVDDLSLAHTSTGTFHREPRTPGTGDFDTVVGSNAQIFWGTDLQGAYDELPLLQAGDNGTGYAVATLLSSGYNVSFQENTAPWDPAALAYYFQSSFPSGAAIPTPQGEPVPVAGLVPPEPGPQASEIGDDSGSVDENSLDLEMAASAAPGAQVYNFYYAESLTLSNLGNALTAFDSCMAAALGFNYGSLKLAAISNSWGLTDTNDSTWYTLEEEAEGIGATVLASSGDQGDAPVQLTERPQGQWPSFPATAAFNDWGVLAVGGTSLWVNGNPDGSWDPEGTTNPPGGYDATSITGIQTQLAWYQNLSGQAVAGSEGGVSLVYNEPLWQAQSAAQSSIRYAAENEGFPYARGVPDVASLGNDAIVITQIEGQTDTVGILAGTSVASPLAAGFVAVMAQYVGEPLGYLDPSLYSLGGYYLENPGTANPPFDAVTAGKNYVFNASSGWDALTGWGTLDVWNLAQDLKSGAHVDYVFDPSAQPGTAQDNQPTAASGLPGWVLPLALIVLVLLIVIVLVASNRRNRSRSAGPAAYSPPPPPPGSPWGSSYGGSPYASGTYGAPPVAYAPPPPVTYTNYPPYPTPTEGPYGRPVYTPAPSPPPSYLAPGPQVNCRFCRLPRPYNNEPCPHCRGPLY